MLITKKRLNTPKRGLRSQWLQLMSFSLCLSLIGSLVTSVLAQAPPTPLTLIDLQIADLQKQIDQLNAQLDVEKALKQRSTVIKDITGTERTIFNDLLPQECDPPDSKTCIGLTNASKPINLTKKNENGLITANITGVNLLLAESRILVYEGIRQISKEIQTKVPNSSTVLIYDEELIKSLVIAQDYSTRLRGLRNDYDKIAQNLDGDLFKLTIPSNSSRNEAGIPIPVSQALRTPEILRSVTQSAIEFIALFRTNVDITNKDDIIETFDRNVLVSTLGAGMRSQKKVTIFVPSLYTPSSTSATQSVISEIQTIQSSTKRTLDRYRSRINPAKQADFSNIETKLNSLEAQSKILFDLATSTPKITQGYRAMELLQDSNTYVLYIEKVLALGNNQTLTNLWSGITIRHSGNVALNYMLFNRDGAVIAANTLYYHSGFQEFNAPRNNLDN